MKPLLKAGEEDRPLADRLWDAAPYFSHKDHKLLKKAKQEEEQAIRDLEAALGI